MLGFMNVSFAVRTARTLWTRAGVSLAATAALASPCCESQYGYSDCIKAVASSVCNTGGVTTGHLAVESDDAENCPLLESAEMITYNNRDGKPGFDPDAGDILVDALSASSVPPGHSLGVGSFSSAGNGGSVNATHWQITVTHTGGPPVIFSKGF